MVQFLLELSLGGSFGGLTESYISNSTGAVKVSQGAYADHAVSIIGWDDNYSVENWNEFDEYYRPKNNGAWIARNSWGEESGKNGLIYISYEDKTASFNMNGIIKSTNNINYDNIYQYDYYYPNKQKSCRKKTMICNIFDRKTSKTEYLTQVSLHVPGTYTCKVFVNPNGTGKSKNDLQLVSLEAGESETLNAGYHTLEFADPIEITSSQFAVAIEISSTDDKDVLISCVEKETEEYSPVEIQTGKYYKLDSYKYVYEDNWSDWSDLGNEGAIPTIKAFTTNELIDESLKSIEITTPPNKTSYYVGDDFNPEGMVVKANYNSNTNPSVILNSSDYTISNGTNLSESQSSVTISYEGKTVNQAISVQKNNVTDLNIKTMPTKTEYKEGQNFDPTGMVIEATYENGDKKDVTGFNIQNGNNLKTTTTEVIITYGGKQASITVNVTPNPLISIRIEREPNKKDYVVGQNFDTNGMIVKGIFQDETEQEILDYTLENNTNLTKEQTSVIIKYEGKETSQPITVSEKAIVNIEIVQEPKKMQYKQNKEELDLSGAKIKVNYNDGTNEEIILPSELVETSGFSNEELGEKTITIKYQNKTVSFNVQIIEEPKPRNSNLDNLNCKVNNVKYYTYTDSNNQEYMIIDITLNGIERSSDNDSVEYYYYISPNQNESSIVNWVKLNENSNNDNTIEFKINTKDINNYSEIIKSDNLYLYIKEVAKLGGNQEVKISKAIEFNPNTTIEIYENDAKKAESKEDDQNIDKKADNTIATKKLPNTGGRIIFILITGLIVIAVIKYVKYIKLKDIR